MSNGGLWYNMDIYDTNMESIEIMATHSSLHYKLL